MPKSRKSAPQEEFEEAVRALAVDTVVAFKDVKTVRKHIRTGNFAQIANVIVEHSVVQPEYCCHDIVEAAERDAEGLLELAVDAEYALRIAALADRWAVVMTTKELLPSLAWPRGFKIP